MTARGRGTITDETVKVCVYNFTSKGHFPRKQGIIESMLRTI